MMADPVSTQAPGKGGRFTFEDGGTYCGGWEEGRAHGHGVCTGPKAQGEYTGSWNSGFEVSGVYTWPSGAYYEGKWKNGKRHGLGVEMRGRWMYKGEWTDGYKGRYGVRKSVSSNAKYEGTWVQGLQDGYGSETYGDGGTYQGQWYRGMRQGYGVRVSAPYGLGPNHLQPNGTFSNQPSNLSLNVPGSAEEFATSAEGGRPEDVRGGFVLKANSEEPVKRRVSSAERPGFLRPGTLLRKLKKQKSTGDVDRHALERLSSSVRSDARQVPPTLRDHERQRQTTPSMMSNESTVTWATAVSERVPAQEDANDSFVAQEEQLDPNVTETYMGEWKNDKRTGFGISERSDGLKYEGEWYNNKKYGYGVTTLKDGTKEEGKYKNNVLITSEKKKHSFIIRSAKFRERIEQAVNAASRAYMIAMQKGEIAMSRTANARGEAELADMAAIQARDDAEEAVKIAVGFVPDFKTATETLRSLPIFPHQSTVPSMETSRLKEFSPKPFFSKLRQQNQQFDTAPTGTHYALQSQSYNMMPQQQQYGNFEATQESQQFGLNQNYLPQTSPGQQNVTLSMSQQNSNLYGTSAASQNYGLMQPNQQYNIAQRVPDSNTSGQRSPTFMGQPNPSFASDLGRNPNQNYGSDQNVKMGESIQNYGMLQPKQAYSTSQQNQGYGVPPQSQNYVQQPQFSMGQQSPNGTASQQAHSLATTQQGQSIPTSQQGLNYSTPQQSQNYTATAQNPNYVMEQPIRNLQQSQLYGGAPQGQNVGTSLPSQGYIPQTNPKYSRFQQRQTPGESSAMDDHFDHYRKSFSRENSISRYSSRSNLSKSQTPVSTLSRTPNTPVGRPIGLRDRAPTPASRGMTPAGSFLDTPFPFPAFIPDLDAAPISPLKRANSLTERPDLKQILDATSTGDRAASPTPSQRRRKKSLPDELELPKTPIQMSREEVAMLSHIRRQEVVREMAEAERYRANPLLYLTSPQLKQWLWQNKLLIFVCAINIVFVITVILSIS